MSTWPSSKIQVYNGPVRMCSGGLGDTTYIPLDPTEELPVLLIPLREVICRDEDLPPVFTIFAHGIEKFLAEHGTLILARVIRPDRDTRGEPVEFAQPVLKGG